MKTKAPIPEIRSTSYKLTFGKYKGMTVQDVIETEPSYILWMQDEKLATFSKKILDYADEAEIAQRFDEAMNGELSGMRLYDILGDE